MSKPFDAVAWMRKRRAEIDKEDEGLSWEEKARKTAQCLSNDPLWKRLQGRMIAPPASPAPRAESTTEGPRTPS
jgi:hypothetical protein